MPSTIVLVYHLVPAHSRSVDAHRCPGRMIDFLARCREGGLLDAYYAGCIIRVAYLSLDPSTRCKILLVMLPTWRRTAAKGVSGTVEITRKNIWKASWPYGWTSTICWCTTLQNQDRRNRNQLRLCLGADTHNMSRRLISQIRPHGTHTVKSL